MTIRKRFKSVTETAYSSIPRGVGVLAYAIPETGNDDIMGVNPVSYMKVPKSPAGKVGYDGRRRGSTGQSYNLT